MNTELNYKVLEDDNKELQRALMKSKRTLNKLTSKYKFFFFFFNKKNYLKVDFDNFKQIHEEFKKEFSNMKKEKLDLQKKIIDLNSDNLNNRRKYEKDINNLKRLIEEREKELDNFENKSIPQFNKEMMKIKLMNELTVQFQYDLDNKSMEIEKLHEDIFEYRRKIQILEAKNESLKFETEKDILHLKERQKVF